MATSTTIYQFVLTFGLLTESDNLQSRSLPYRQIAAILIYEASLDRRFTLEKLPTIIDDERVVTSGCFRMMQDVPTLKYKKYDDVYVCEQRRGRCTLTFVDGLYL